MKKIIIVLIALCASGSAQAQELVGGTSTTIGGGTFTPSAKVHIKVKSSTTAYTAASAHEAGTIEYASGGGNGLVYDGFKIYSKDCTSNPCGTSPVSDPASATTFPTGTWQ